VFLIAAANNKGRPATFTSGAGTTRKPDEGVISIAYMGVDCEVRHPITGRVQWVSGTSPATANASGDLTGQGIYETDEIKNYWEDNLTIHKSFYPEWLEGKHHEAMGRGFIK
jgi:hypothetical protein